MSGLVDAVWLTVTVTGAWAEVVAMAVAGLAATTTAAAEVMRLPTATATAVPASRVGHHLRGLLDGGPDRDDDRVGESTKTAGRERTTDDDAEREHHEQRDHASPSRGDDILRLNFRLRLVEQWVVRSDRATMVFNVGERDRDPRGQRPAPGATVDAVRLVGRERRAALRAR